MAIYFISIQFTSPQTRIYQYIYKNISILCKWVLVDNNRQCNVITEFYFYSVKNKTDINKFSQLIYYILNFILFNFSIKIVFKYY
jgi:hypothetical protein